MSLQEKLDFVAKVISECDTKSTLVENRMLGWLISITLRYFSSGEDDKYCEIQDVDDMCYLRQLAKKLADMDDHNNYDPKSKGYKKLMYGSKSQG